MIHQGSTQQEVMGTYDFVTGGWAAGDPDLVTTPEAYLDGTTTLGGNPGLQEETGNTVTLGGVYIHSLPGLTIPCQADVSFLIDLNVAGALGP